MNLYNSVNNLTAHDIVKQFGLQPHPEGGFFKESYRSKETVAVASLNDQVRNYSTAIYFLLPQGNKSKFHRIQSDEIWHFYLGGPLEIISINKQGILEKVKLGSNIKQGELLQYTVPKQCWFASRPLPGSDYSFVGCTVAPGFDFADFELAETKKLLDQFPEHKHIIQELT